MVSAHSNGVHDVFAPMVLAGGAVWHVISVMNSPEVVPELMGRHQIGLLLMSGKRLNYLSSSLDCELDEQRNQMFYLTLVRIVFP